MLKRGRLYIHASKYTYLNDHKNNVYISYKLYVKYRSSGMLLSTYIASALPKAKEP